MKSMLSISLIGLSLTLATALPSFAKEVTGPRGGTASGSGFVVPNRMGGYTGSGSGSYTTPKGGTGMGQVRFQTNGQGQRHLRR